MKKLLSFILSAVMLLSMMTFISAGEKQAFSDVKETRWSYKEIMYAVENGYMNGVGDGKFSPSGKVTRGMVVTVLYRLSGSDRVTYSKKFRDVPEGKWYTDAVIWASNRGIVNGIDAKTFAPDNNITREQLAAIIMRYAEFDYVITDKKADITGYSDYKKISSYARENMAWCAEAGLVTGVTDTTLDPKGSATREQFAAILYRYDHAGYKYPETQTFGYKTAYNAPEAISKYSEKEYPLVNDADVYVAVSGNDKNPGTLDKPVKTFEAARNLVRELKKTATKEIVVAFKAGEYGNLDITLTKEDSGSEQVPIKYCKYGDGDVVFNNGATLKKSDFKPISESEKSMFNPKKADSIYKASLDGYFENGLPQGITPYQGNTPCIIARTPDKAGGVDAYYDGCITPVDGDVHFPGMQTKAPMKTELDKLDNVDDMKIIGYIIWGYRVDHLYATGYDKTTGILYFDPEREVPEEYPSAGLRTPGIGYDKLYFENNPKFLSVEGEYWCDSKTNTIYFYNPTEDINIGKGGKFIVLDDADYVSIVGLSFKNCYNECAITVKDSEHVTVDRVYVEGVTGIDAHAGDSEQGLEYPGTNTVLSVVGESDWLLVTGCEFAKFKNHAIDLYPNRDAVYLTEDHIKIDNNYFHDCGNGNTFMNNAIIDRSVGTVISHNLFKNSESGALDLGTLGIFEYNVMDNMMTSTQDYGCIYTQLCNGVLSRGNTIRYNIFNEPVSNGANYSIYLDDGTTNMKVYGNVFAGNHNAVVIHESRSHEVHDNLFVGAWYTINGLITCEDDGTILTGGVAPSPIGEGGQNWQWNGLYRLCMKDKPKEGEPGYEQWKEKFPDLYQYYVDLDNLTGQYNLACPYNEVYNNVDIYGVNERELSEDRIHHLAAYAEVVGKIHDNVQFTTEENPGFRNPAHGDYMPLEGCPLYGLIPFDQIGRY